jgi:DNA phosphorothioation-dependent restriction protein DptH
LRETRAIPLPAPICARAVAQCLQPGGAALVADALLSLQQKREHADLRYDVRLFSPDPDAPVVGEALESLVRPETTVNEAADAFATSTGSHLFSKLKLAQARAW